MNKISFFDEHFLMKKGEHGVYKLIINEQWFYIGSSVNLKSRLSSWKHQILIGKPKNANIKFLLPVMETVRFEIIERVPNGVNPKIQEDYHIKRHLDNFDCLNMCPNSFGNRGKRKAFGQSVKWKPHNPPTLPKKVSKFKKDGTFIDSFESLTKAAKSISDEKSLIAQISHNASGKRKWVRGFVFKFVDENGNILEPPKFKNKKHIKKPYDIVNKPMVTSRKFNQKALSGEIVKTWSNYEAAAKSIGVSRGAIYKYLTKSKHLPHHGYYWEYA